MLVLENAGSLLENANIGKWQHLVSDMGSRLCAARIFDWRGPNHKSVHAMTSSEMFKRGTFYGAKILQNGRPETVAWFGN